MWRGNFEFRAVVRGEAESREATGEKRHFDFTSFRQPTYEYLAARPLPSDLQTPHRGAIVLLQV